MESWVKRWVNAPLGVRLVAFLLTLAVLWLPFLGLGYGLIADANTRSIVTMSALFIEFLVLLWVWGRWVYGRSHPLQHYGLGLDRRNGRDLVQGLGIGGLSLLGLFVLEGILGWLTWNPWTIQLLPVGLAGLLVALGVGLGEELIFRGWLLDELQRDCRLAVALWADSVAFAVLHFIRPLPEILHTSPQFIGLVLLGLTLVWAKRGRGDRLGLSIGLHAGLIWGFYLINVGNLITYTHRVPQWLTGVNDNPLAGGMGLVFLGAIAYWAKRSAGTSHPSQGSALE